MLHQKRIAIVIPAHNEEEFITGVLDHLPAGTDSIIVINDGSRDATGHKLRHWQNRHPNRLTILKNSAPRGVGAAICQGYREAARQNCDIAVVMAGDGQMDPADLPGLVSALVRHQAVYAKGNRIIWPGSRQVMPFARYWGNRVLGAITGWLTGLRGLTDSQCGYTALDLKLYPGPWDFYPRYGFPNDILIRLAGLGFPIVQYPVRPVYGREVSGIRFWPFVTALIRIFARGWWLRFQQKRTPRLIHIPYSKEDVETMAEAAGPGSGQPPVAGGIFR